MPTPDLIARGSQQEGYVSPAMREAAAAAYRESKRHGVERLQEIVDQVAAPNTEPERVPRSERDRYNSSRRVRLDTVFTRGG